MNAARVKNLCIALEALSRVPGYRAEKATDKIHDELEKEMKETPDAPNTEQISDNEIPF